MKVFVLILIIVYAECRFYSRCELARKLYQFSFFRRRISNWVCLIESVSGGDTKAVTGPFLDDTYDVGLFQINDGYWCGRNYVGGRCNINCDKLLHGDGVRTALFCVRLIYDAMGLDGWYGWARKCRKRYLPDVRNECQLNRHHYNPEWDD